MSTLKHAVAFVCEWLAQQILSFMARTKLTVVVIYKDGTQQEMKVSLSSLLRLIKSATSTGIDMIIVNIDIP